MPELPEVETVRLQLLRAIVGKTIRNVTVLHQKTIDFNTKFTQILPGKIIADIDRVGKLLIFSFKREPDLFLLAHLKMTGQFFFVDKKGEVSGGGHSMTEVDTRELPGRHTRVYFDFTDGSALYFNDMRLFGYTKLADKKTTEVARSGFGPELIDPDFNTAWFVDTLRKKKTSVKAALLNQAFVSGLGNIYVDEALWRAKVKPTRRADRVNKKEAAAIAAASRDVMLESIKVGGTTFQHFVDTGGNNGNFTDYLQVFGKQGTECSRCGAIMEKIKVAGRGTHFCPGCQK